MRTREEVECWVRIYLKENSPWTYDRGERIWAEDQIKQVILWWIKITVGVQVRQGKGNWI